MQGGSSSNKSNRLVLNNGAAETASAKYDGWFISPGYNGPWTIVAPEFVPRPILRVPVQYYRVPPPAWRGWQRAAAPRWEPRWGQRWAEHPPVKRAQHQHPPQQQQQRHEAPHGAQHHQDKHEKDPG